VGSMTCGAFLFSRPPSFPECDRGALSRGYENPQGNGCSAKQPLTGPLYSDTRRMSSACNRPKLAFSQ